FANEIRIGPARDKKEWPADTEFKLHGIIVDSESEWVEVKKRKADRAPADKAERNDKAPPDKDKADKADKAKTEESDEEAIKIYPMADPAITDDKNERLTWSRLVEHKGKFVEVGYQSGKYFNDLLTPFESRIYAESYRDQLEDVLRIVDPVDENGYGVV